MLAQLPPELAALFTERSLLYATAAWVIIQNLGRIFHAIKAGGGLVGIWRAVVFGTNTPKAE